MSIFKPTRIFIHHSLTKDSYTVSWGAIRKYHIETLKWSDIGYHAGVELVLSGEEANYEVLLGRSWDRKGAHVKGQNHDSLGICFVGNYDKIQPKPKMLEAGAKIIAIWMKLFDIPINRIYSHHDFNLDKSCPGRFFNLIRLKMEVQEIRGSR